MPTKLISLALAGSLAACVNIASEPPPAPTTAPQAEPAQAEEIVVPQDVPAGVPQPQIPAELNALLDELEASAEDLHAFTAEVTYEKQDAILGRKELRAGKLIYRLDPHSREKAFAILFDSTIVNNRKRQDPKHYIFNGRWLAEIDAQNKQFIKREIVPPGKALDPLKLGEGPFPIPVGQPKAEVLARFDVTAAEIPGEGMLKELKEVRGLSLRPKPSSKEAEQYAKLDLFYERQSLLPVGIVISETNGDRKTVRLTDAKRNPDLADDQLQKLNIQEPDPREWRIDIRPWAESP